ncbi:MAG: YadA C-terminal domain-containing protein [Zoogloeaceae bacterium]|nr:YadA C-terminal domain-containing protein [Zoogloeaceae bacterium]
MGGVLLPQDKQFAISANVGNFRSENAVAIGAQFRLSDRAVGNLAIGGGLSQGGYGARAGVTFAW